MRGGPIRHPKPRGAICRPHAKTYREWTAPLSTGYQPPDEKTDRLVTVLFGAARRLRARDSGRDPAAGGERGLRPGEAGPADPERPRACRRQGEDRPQPRA